MKYFYFLLCMGCVPLFAQPFAIGRTSISFFDEDRNRTIPTEIFYPADTNGVNVAVTTSTIADFPILVFGHGFLMTFDAYENFWENLVPKGYILAFPKTEGSLSPSHINFAKDLAFVLDSFSILNTQSSSLFFSRVSTNNAIMGHSMGGGCAILSKQYSSQVNHIITFAAAETNPSAIAAAASITFPTLTIAGVNDCVTPQQTNQLPIYNAMQSTCKKYIAITGGSHCQMANSNFFCNLGEATCSPAPTITREEQHEILFSYLTKWLDYYLKDDCNAGALFESLQNSDSSNIFNSTCILCEVLFVTNLQIKFSVEVFPNPFTDKVVVLSKNQNDFTYQLFNLEGKIIFKGFAKSEVILDTSSLQKGVYFIKVVESKSNFIRKLIKH